MPIIVKPIFVNSDGRLQSAPEDSQIHIGSIVSPPGLGFTLNGKGLLFDDGSSSAGTGTSITLQSAYDLSLDSNNNASIKLSTGKDFVIYDNDESNLYFKIDSETGRVTITGDLEVFGTSTIITSTVQDADHWLISPALPSQSALIIRPDFTTGTVDLVSIRPGYSSPEVFKITSDGTTLITDLATGHIYVNGNIDINGTVDGVDVSSLQTQVTSLAATLTTHLLASTSTKHGAKEVSVMPTPSFAPAATDVQSVIDALDLKLATISQSGAGLFVTNVSPTATGLVSQKQYAVGTIPANAVLTTATSDVSVVTVSFVAEGGSAFYSPTVEVGQVGSIPVMATLTEHPTDKRFFLGTASIAVVTPANVRLTASTGAITYVDVLAAPPVPTISSLSIGSYPGLQTAVKAGDVLSVTGAVQNAAAGVTLLTNYGAAGNSSSVTLGATESGGSGLRSFTGTFVVGSGTGSLKVRAFATSSFGSTSSFFESSNAVLLDQLAPTFGPITVAYPVGTGALKVDTTATVTAEIFDFATVSYTAGTEISVAGPTSYAVTKNVTCVGGTYVDSGNNYTITANKISNGTQSIANALVKIANTAPTAAISILGSPTRLRSSASGISYTVTLTASENLASAPLVTVSAGILSSFTGSGKVWTSTLTIRDSDPRGVQTFTIDMMLNEAIISGTVITSGQSFTIGGFALRQITYPAFSRYQPIGANVLDVSKVQVRYAGITQLLAYQTSTANVFGGFTIVNSVGVFNSTGNNLFLSDADFAGANTTGSLVVEIEETE
jgi:hypothetical protein